MHLDTAQTSLTNTAFILAGVLTGLGMGFCLTTKQHNRPIINGLFGLCAVSLLAMTVVAKLDLEKHGWSKDTLLVFYILMMALAGASSLGFIGLALSRSVQQGFMRPVVGEGREWEVSEVYSAGAVEWFIQVWGAIITQVTTGDVGFIVVTALVWLGFALILFEDTLGDTWDATFATPLPAMRSSSGGQLSEKLIDPVPSRQASIISGSTVLSSDEVRGPEP